MSFSNHIRKVVFPTSRIFVSALKSTSQPRPACERIANYGFYLELVDPEALSLSVRHSRSIVQSEISNGPFPQPDQAVPASAINHRGH